MIGLVSSFFILLDQWVGRFSLSIVIERRMNDFAHVITCIYDPNKRALRPDF